MPNLRSRRWWTFVGLIALAGVGLAVRPSLSIAVAGEDDSRVEDLAASASALQLAIDLYTEEHDGIPPEADRIDEQLLGLTDELGDTWSVGTRFGPYLMRLPPGAAGRTSIGAPGSSDVGWWYDPSTATVEPAR